MGRAPPPTMAVSLMEVMHERLRSYTVTQVRNGKT